MAGRPADRPNVFRPPTGITQSFLYQAELRIPQPDLPGASGRATDMALRVSVADAGELIMVPSPQGPMQYFVRMNARPIER